MQDVNRLLKQYQDMAGMMKKMKKLGQKGLMRHGLSAILPQGIPALSMYPFSASPGFSPRIVRGYAGVHRSADREADEWVPACAGIAPIMLIRR